MTTRVRFVSSVYAPSPLKTSPPINVRPEDVIDHRLQDHHIWFPDVRFAGSCHELAPAGLADRGRRSE